MNKIIIRGLKFFACHGVNAEEKVTPQPFVFDVDLFYDFYGAAKTDSIQNTVNYSSVCKIIEKVVKSNSFNLIEKLAYECLFSLMENTPAKSVSLTLYKPEAPLKQSFSSVGVSLSCEREKVYLSLGSSCGDRENYLSSALRKLNTSRGITVKKVSGIIETEPFGGVAKNKFLNLAAEVETFLSPRELLEEIHRIESECGRVRSTRWDDRTLDIDIVFFGNKIIREEGLTIPHPELYKRDFVLTPLNEIAPGFYCPVCGKTVAELAASLK